MSVGVVVGGSQASFGDEQSSPLAHDVGRQRHSAELAVQLPTT